MKNLSTGKKIGLACGLGLLVSFFLPYFTGESLMNLAKEESALWLFLLCGAAAIFFTFKDNARVAKISFLVALGYFVYFWFIKEGGIGLASSINALSIGFYLQIVSILAGAIFSKGHMKVKHITLTLISFNIILAYFLFNIINDVTEFEKESEGRIAENVQKLKDLRQIQSAYKTVNNIYADNFESLLNFLENDSMPIVKSYGETPDTLINGKQMSDEQALEMGLISRDTTYVLAKDSVFNYNYKQNRNEKYPLNLTTLTHVPHSEEVYSIDADSIEIGKVKVQVFEISTTYRLVFTGLDAENKKYDLDALLKVGSLVEASINGNWE